MTSITPQLRASARSAYRQLARAAAHTFSGDDRMLQAFRLKLSTDSRSWQFEKNPSAYERITADALEAANFLRKNVVQATRTRSNTEDHPRSTGEIWQLRVTKDTELGDNDSIKSPNRRTSSERSCCQSDPVPQPIDTVVPSNSPRYYSALKKAHRQRIVPILNKADIEESFVRGRGPGGQSINKTKNNVQLFHLPTGIRVSCQETRSLDTNRRLARRKLIEKLDELSNPGLTRQALKKAKEKERERQRRRKKRKKERAGDQLSTTSL